MICAKITQMLELEENWKLVEVMETLGKKNKERICEVFLFNKGKM